MICVFPCKACSCPFCNFVGKLVLSGIKHDNSGEDEFWGKVQVQGTATVMKNTSSTKEGRGGGPAACHCAQAPGSSRRTRKRALSTPQSTAQTAHTPCSLLQPHATSTVQHTAHENTPTHTHLPCIRAARGAATPCPVLWRSPLWLTGCTGVSSPPAHPRYSEPSSRILSPTGTAHGCWH